MKSTTILLASVLASAAIAQPHQHQHQHNARHHHNKRAETVVWVTDWVTDIETVGITTTIWVSSGYVAPTTTSSSTSKSTPSTSSSSKNTDPPAQFFEGGDRPSTTSSSTSVYVAPVPTYVAPTTSVSPYVAPAPAPSPSTEAAPAYVAPPSAYTPPVETTTAAAAAPAQSQTSTSGSSGGVCSPGSPCVGDLTYYEAGLGACGLTTDGNTEKVVALPHELMGTQSNGNPYCGKTITIQCPTTGKTTTAVVADKCMGCVGYAIDISNAAFLDLDSLDVGRTSAKWWFN